MSNKKVIHDNEYPILSIQEIPHEFPHFAWKYRAMNEQ